MVNKHSKPNAKKVRIGFIGAGWWATTNHMPILKKREDVEMVSVCGLDEELLERCKKDFGFTHTTTDYRKLLRQDLNGVVISTPHSLHAEHTLAVLRAGCHVMCEKPFAITTNEARTIVNFARAEKLHIVVPYGWHYRPLCLKAKKLIDEDCVGKVMLVSVHMASSMGDILTGKPVNYEGYVDPDPSTWADPLIASGGYGLAQLSHATGLLFWLTGLRVESVSAIMSQPGSRVDLYDAMNAKFEGGAIGTISGSGTLPPNTPGGTHLEIRIYGTKGFLHLDLARDHLSLHTHNGRHEVIPSGAGDGAYKCDGPPNQFIDLILGLTEDNNSPGEVAMRSVELLDLAYRSSRSGKEEKL